MGGELIGLVAVTLGMGVPLGALYTYYRVRKLRSEERLAAISDASEISGGIARVGAIQAALAAGLRQDAKQLQTKYLLDKNLSTERKAAIERAFASDQARQALRYPSLANKGMLARLGELDTWRMSMASKPRVFPIAA